MPTLSDLEARQLLGIVAIRARSSQGTAICSGVLIAPGAALTAAHCFDRDRDGLLDFSTAEGVPDALVIIGRDVFDPTTTIPVGDTALHPQLDVALIHINADGKALPISPAKTGIDGTWIGSPVELAGFGASSFSGPGALAFAVGQVIRVDPDYLVTEGFGHSGACAGDSGGPLLGWTDDGIVHVVGVLDDGDPTCVGEDYFTRLDRLSDWIPFLRALEEGASRPPSCGPIVRRGLCVRGRAFWCDGTSVTVDNCAADDRVCGWDGSAQGFRCVAFDADPCEGRGNFALCEEDAIVSCKDGRLRRAACSACNGRCVPWGGADGAACVPQ